MNKQQIAALLTSVPVFLGGLGFIPTQNAVAESVIAKDVAKPKKKPTVIRWSPAKSKTYAKQKMKKYGWKSNYQFQCLNNLWYAESRWLHTAYNKKPVKGKHAGGIPQILGLDPKTPPDKQIIAGLDYIDSRYATPCGAWSHFKTHKWY